MAAEPPVAPPGSALAALAIGATAGAVWGAVARGWMRFVSGAPEFTWNGTVSILIIFALFGLGQALALIVHRSGRGRAAPVVGHVVAIAATVPLGLGAGGPLLPSIIVGALALGSVALRPQARLALVLVAATPTLFVLRQLLDDIEAWRAVVGWGLMFGVYLPLVWALARSLRPVGGADLLGLPPVVDA